MDSKNTEKKKKPNKKWEKVKEVVKKPQGFC